MLREPRNAEPTKDMLGAIESGEIEGLPGVMVKATDSVSVAKEY